MPTITRSLAIADIIRDPALQPRIRLDQGIVRKYAALLREARHDAKPSPFPAIVVYDVAGEGLLLADGWHRIGASELLHEVEISAEIREGTRDDALRHALEYNALHGLNYSTQDKRRAIETYLKHPIFSAWGPREIGRRLGVSHNTVSAAQKRLKGEQRPRPERAPVRTLAQVLEGEARWKAEAERLKQQVTDGSLFNVASDTVEEIARAMVANLSVWKAENIIKAMRPLIAAKKARGAHAG